MNNDNSLIGCGCLVLIAVAAIGISIAAFNHQEQHTFTVSGKDRVCDGGKDGSCWYEVYGTEGQVFKNEDSFLAGKWDSASFQARFQINHTYQVTTTGWRVPFLSMKPNIIEMSEVH